MPSPDRRGETPWIAPEHEIVAIISQPNCRIWARGPYRGDCFRKTGHLWIWWVYHAVGPVSYGRGEEKGLRRAQAACLARLKEVADAGLPGKDLFAGKAKPKEQSDA